MPENSWEHAEFTIGELHRMIEEDKVVEVPMYQRGTVWSESQVNALMDTIKKGLPFGSILLYQKSDNLHYMIIDGLQRTTAMYKFVSEPGRFFNETDIDLKIIRKIVEQIPLLGNKEETKKILSDEIRLWVNSKKSMKDIANMQYVEFGLYLSSKYEQYKGNEILIGQMIEPMLSEFKSVCQDLLTITQRNTFFKV